MIKYAFYKSLINPFKPCQLAGFSYRAKDRKTLGPPELYAKILWLRSNTDLIFITIDALYFSKELGQNIFRFASSRFNLSSQNIILNATHTHSAPNQYLEAFGPIDKQYISEIELKITEGLEFCYTNFQEGIIDFQHLDCDLDLFVCRRKMGRDIKTLFLKKNTLMLPNDKKPVDNKIHLITIFDLGFRLRAIVYSFSCHPVFNMTRNISSDFIGEISSRLEEGFCDFTMFLQGFAGDVRPNFSVTEVPLTQVKNFLNLIFHDKVFANYHDEHFNHFCSRISRCIIENTAHYATKLKSLINIKSSWDIHKSAFRVRLQSVTSKTLKDMCIKLALISSNLIVSIPAEVHSGYIDVLNSEFPTLNIFPLGYADGMIGYLPCERELSEGGYEVEGCAKMFGWDDRLAESSIRGFTEKLISEICQLTGFENDKVHCKLAGS